jgi:hypothetical protein
MTAYMKTNVLRREEKGIGTISFRRLLVAGLGAIVFFIFGSRMIGWLPGCMGGIAFMIFLVVLTQPVGGFPLVMHAADVLHGLAVISQSRERRGPLGQAGAAVLQVSERDGLLEAGTLFQPVDRLDDTLSAIGPEEEWAISTELEGDGLAFVDDPLAS